MWEVFLPHTESVGIYDNEWAGKQNDNTIRNEKALDTAMGVGLPVIANRFEKIMPCHCNQLA